jgi:hypothetical protein
MASLSPAQQQVLKTLHRGATLKAHRYLDGRKQYKLHHLDGSSQTVRRPTVDALKRAGLIDSNKKFPAATYLLTDEGRRLAVGLAGPGPGLLTARAD